ncbi:hypothetical protein BC834DRAFT_905347 [Gloeopeniophorella convolvens]|nr:hypothetical protein BC834DRAFT_905347 [Gloeopeniophorella convolvens]
MQQGGCKWDIQMLQSSEIEAALTLVPVTSSKAAAMMKRLKVSIISVGRCGVSVAGRTYRTECLLNVPFTTHNHFCWLSLVPSGEGHNWEFVSPCIRDSRTILRSVVVFTALIDRPLFGEVWCGWRGSHLFCFRPGLPLRSRAYCRGIGASCASEM